MNHKFGNELPGELFPDSGEFPSPSGRGLPAGWLATADDRLCSTVRYRLMTNEDVDASFVSVQAAAGDVTLEGRVDSFQEAQLIVAIAETVPGVKHVHNGLRVFGSSGERPHS